MCVIVQAEYKEVYRLSSWIQDANEITAELYEVEDKGDNYIGEQKSFDEYYNQTYGGEK